MPDSILFWGELPSYTLSGISLSNKCVLDILQAGNNRLTILEERSWRRSTTAKIFYYLSLYLRLTGLLVRRHFDVLYFTVPVSNAGIRKFRPLIFLGRMLQKRIRIIGHIHRGDAEAFMRASGKNENRLLALLQGTDDIIFLADQYAGKIKNALPGKKIWILPNTSAIERKEKLIPKPYTRQFICLSNYIPTKGLLELVACFARDELKEFVLTVYGQQNDPDFYEELQRVSTSNVLLKDDLKRTDVAGTLEDFDCLILPSPNEGMPLVILEAMSLGVPVVSTRVGVVEDMLGRDYPFLADPGSKESLSQAIQRFDACPDKHPMGENLFNRYKRYYSNELHQKRVMEIFTFHHKKTT